MIEFETIRWQNLLSTGNEFTEVRLNKSKNTLIVGDNGAGKSTLLDALFFALFGKPYRKINKPQLINSITRKNLLVELEFKVNGKSYKIRRGIKPNIFEIFSNGELIRQPSSVDEYQDILEKTILRFKLKSFSQYSVLGSTNYVPFMRLTAAHRREVIEDVLDLEIFSKMNILMKAKVDENQKSIAKEESDINSCESQIDVHRKMSEAYRKNNDDIIQAKKKQLEQYLNELSVVKTEYTTYNKKLEALEVLKAQKDAIEEKITKLEQLEKAYQDKVSSINEMISFLNTDKCPTCNQHIHEEFKTEEISKKNSKLKALEESFSPIREKMDRYKRELAENFKQLDDLPSISSAVDDKRISGVMLSRQIENLQNEISTESKSQAEIDQTHLLKELQDKLAWHKKEYARHLKEKEVIDVSKNLLKDTGIKTKIIQQYIPVINQLINKYLHALDFFVSFELDENFNETIKSRHRDEFSYESFSEGEKMRINLAILFAWREISNMRNSSPTNLLIMDEIFDSSLDQAGTDEMLRIIDTLTGDSNTFIISHKGDVLYDHFRSVIKFEKQNNFSKMVLRA